jgi:hypothetical protein
MKRKRYTEPQIVFALQPAEGGTPGTKIPPSCLGRSRALGRVRR